MYTGERAKEVFIHNHYFNSINLSLSLSLSCCQIGLVDELGGVLDAVAFARSAAKLDPAAPYELFPKKLPPFQALAESMSRSNTMAETLTEVVSGAQMWMDAQGKANAVLTKDPYSRF